MFQKAKIVLISNFIALFVLIITTPYFIRFGVSWASEETMEGIFLTIELCALIYFFQQYDRIVKKKDEEAWLLDVKLKKKERELLNAFQYLGKVNVEISMIKSLLEKTQVPASKQQLRELYGELLRLVCSVTGQDSAALRIVNIKNGRTIFEQFASMQENEVCKAVPIGNNELIRKFRQKDKSMLGSSCVFYSEAENYSAKAFIIVQNMHQYKYSQQEREFLQAVANQCEVMFLLFESKQQEG
jgi:hypothetical protein